MKCTFLVALFRQSYSTFEQYILLVALNQRYIVLTKTTAAQNEDALSYHKVRRLYVLAAVLAATIIFMQIKM